MSQILLLDLFCCWIDLSIHFTFFLSFIIALINCLLHFLLHFLYSSAPEFLFGSFCDFSLLSFSFCSCIVFLIVLNCLSRFSCSLLSCLQIAILGSLSSNHRCPCLWGWLLWNYCVSLVMSCLSDSSCSLKFCISVLTFQIISHL